MNTKHEIAALIMTIQFYNMRDFKFVLITTFLLSFAHSLCAQSETTDSNMVYPIESNSYLYENKAYSYRELGPLFREQNEFIAHHEVALKKKKSATTWGFMTIGAGIYGAVIAVTCEDLGCIALAIPMGIVPITGTIALIQIAAYGREKRKSLSVLNNSLGKRDLGFRNNSSLSIGAGVNGIGLFYCF